MDTNIPLTFGTISFFDRHKDGRPAPYCFQVLC